jgi:hypothetical protein
LQIDATTIAPVHRMRFFFRGFHVGAMLELRKKGRNQQMSVLGSSEKGARLIRALVRGDTSTTTSVIAGKVGCTAFMSRGGGFKEAISIN